MALKRIFLTALLLSLFLNTSVEAKTEIFSGKVVGVSDGDTISVLVNGIVRKVRLNGIDCPEKKQAFGQQAKSFTSASSFDKEVKVLGSGTDRYKRTIGEVILPNGENLNELLLQNGFAWWYKKYSSDEHKHQLEDQARKQKRGLWQDQHASAPWDFRKAKTASRAIQVRF